MPTSMLRALAAGFVAISLLWGGMIQAQTPSEVCLAHEKAKAQAPRKIEGTILKVDPAAGTVTIQETSGKIHEFHTSKETLETMKVGGSIEATLRPTC